MVGGATTSKSPALQCAGGKAERARCFALRQKTVFVEWHCVTAKMNRSSLVAGIDPNRTAAALLAMPGNR